MADHMLKQHEGGVSKTSRVLVEDWDARQAHLDAWIGVEYLYSEIAPIRIEIEVSINNQLLQRMLDDLNDTSIVRQLLERPLLHHSIRMSYGNERQEEFLNLKKISHFLLSGLCWNLMTKYFESSDSFFTTKAESYRSTMWEFMASDECRFTTHG